MWVIEVVCCIIVDKWPDGLVWLCGFISHVPGRCLYRVLTSTSCFVSSRERRSSRTVKTFDTWPPSNRPLSARLHLSRSPIDSFIACIASVLGRDCQIDLATEVHGVLNMSQSQSYSSLMGTRNFRGRRSGGGGGPGMEGGKVSCLLLLYWCRGYCCLSEIRVFKIDDYCWRCAMLGDAIQSGVAHVMAV